MQEEISVWIAADSALLVIREPLVSLELPRPWTWEPHRRYGRTDIGAALRPRPLKLQTVFRTHALIHDPRVGRESNSSISSQNMFLQFFAAVFGITGKRWGRYRELGLDPTLPFR